MSTVSSGRKACFTSDPHSKTLCFLRWGFPSACKIVPLGLSSSTENWNICQTNRLCSFPNLLALFYHKCDVPLWCKFRASRGMKWGCVLFWAQGLDVVRRNSGARCREPMYTFTAGSNRTAGRDGRGVGRLWPTTGTTTFNSAGAEQKGGNSYAETRSRLLGSAQINPTCVQATNSSESKNKSDFLESHFTLWRRLSLFTDSTW